MIWPEIARLRAKPGNTAPLQFHELAKLCKNRVRLMMDTKEGAYPSSFYAAMERALRENNLLESAYFRVTRAKRSCRPQR